MDVLPPIEQGPAGDGQAGSGRRAGWLGYTRDLGRRLGSRLTRPSPSLVCLAIAIVLAVAIFWPSWQDPTSRLLGAGRGDGALMSWFLRWTPRAVGGGLNPLFTDYLNVPNGVNVLWNTSLLLPGFILGPVTAAFGPVLTYNLLSTVALCLSAFTATIALRRYLRSGLAAVIGGLLYGFSPYMLAQDRAHLQLSLAFLPPLLFLAVDNILVGQRRSALLAGGVLGGLAAAQLFIGEEVFALWVIMAVGQVAVMALLFPRQVPGKLRYAAIAFGAAAVVFGAIAAYPLWFQLTGPQHITGDIQSGNRYLTDLWNFVTPTGVQALAPASATRLTAQFSGNFAETNGYLGIPLILISSFTVVRWWRSNPVVRAAALLALGAIVLSMGNRVHVAGHVTGIRLPWAALQRLPLLQSAVPNRFALFVMFFCALLLGVFVDQALRWGWPRRVAAALLVVAVAVTLAPQLAVPSGDVRAPRFFTGPAVQAVPKGSVVLVVPFPGPQTATPMTWQALAGLRFRMPGGYFVGPGPVGFPQYGAPQNLLSGQLGKLNAGLGVPQMDPYRRLAYTYDLVQWRVGTVVVGPMGDHRKQARTTQMLTELLRRPPSMKDGVQVWWNVNPQRLLEQAARELG
jgi:hypothetical protein